MLHTFGCVYKPAPSRQTRKVVNALLFMRYFLEIHILLYMSILITRWWQNKPWIGPVPPIKEYYSSIWNSIYCYIFHCNVITHCWHKLSPTQKSTNQFFLIGCHTVTRTNKMLRLGLTFYVFKIFASNLAFIYIMVIEIIWLFSLTLKWPWSTNIWPSFIKWSQNGYFFCFIW